MVNVAQPPVLLGLDHLEAKVVTDLIEPCGLGRFNLAEIAPDAGMFMGTVRSIGAVAIAERDPALAEVFDELVPFCRSGITVPSGLRYCLMLRWVSSSISSIRIPVWRNTSMIVQVMKARVTV